jgi:hypothetical protein
MDLPNAFPGKTSPPNPEGLSSALGSTTTVWNQLVGWFLQEQNGSSLEWNSYAPKHGWTLLLMLKKRRIAYLGPCADCFRVSFILGDKAVAAARAAGLPKPVLKLLDEAPHYAEGTGLRLVVKSSKDLPAIRKLVQIKLAN